MDRLFFWNPLCEISALFLFAVSLHKYLPQRNEKQREFRGVK